MMASHNPYISGYIKTYFIPQQIIKKNTDFSSLLTSHLEKKKHWAPVTNGFEDVSSSKGTI